MSTKITGKEYPVAKIFSSDFDYEIPSYQRPYAWTVEQTETLFDDLFETYKQDDSEETYFLGSIVLIKEEDRPHAEVIDGQQRLTTLTIFLSVLAHHIKGNPKFFNQLEKYIIEEGNAFEGIEPQPRLSLRNRDNDFFRKYVQEIHIDELLKLDTAQQDTEAKMHIIENAAALDKKVSENLPTEEDVIGFATYLIRRCYLVAVSTPSQASAYRVFSVMNSRGLSLLATDILKSTLIGALPDSEKAKYTEKWEQKEVDLTRKGFNDLFSQIRMILLKTKPRKAIQEDFNDIILKGLDAPKARHFMDSILFPYAEAFDIITNANYTATSDATAVNHLLSWLNRIDNTDWLPVAMSYYYHCPTDAYSFQNFLKKLERLAAYMRITSWDLNHRIMRYAEILIEIESPESKSGYAGSKIDLTEEEKSAFVKKLNDDVYHMVSNKRNYLILRLDSFISDGAASYDTKVFTIEHVLPQTMNPDSEWALYWTVEQHDLWVHKLGNLVPLAKRTNSAAQNYDFFEKQEKYFKSKNGATSYAMTTQVLQYDKWSPEVVEQRHKYLIDVCKRNWELEA